jgi:5'-nucleotidase
VLLTNDDGIDAPGLAVLEEIAAQLAREVWVVAPAHDQSGTSHSISLHAPLRLARLGERRFSVSGTPGDCVAMGLRHLLRETPPDVVLSGVNRGANLGRETVFSGTVGAAMTAMLLGVPGLALSQAFTDRANVPWDSARGLAVGVIRRVWAMEWHSAEACLNINFPPCRPEEAGPMVLTRQGHGVLGGVEVVTGRDPRGVDYHWLQLVRGAPEDLAESETLAIRARKISVTPLSFERTNLEVLGRMRGVVG